MVESEAKELSEDPHAPGRDGSDTSGFQPVIEAIIRLAEKAAKEPRDLVVKPTSRPPRRPSLDLVEADLRAAYAITAKAERYKADRCRQGQGHGTALVPAEGAEPKFTKEQVGERLPRRAGQGRPLDTILDKGTRIDGRDLKTVRPIVSEVGILPRAHGSALFTRGETQALVVATLGTGEDEQYIDSLEGTYKERFLLHYNFPPYSVGETGRMGSPGRREIGHGKLAWRAIRPMLPTAAEFPYTVRIVSEITESNGSSSMATVCGSSLALDGRRRTAEAADRRHRDGPHPRG